MTTPMSDSATGRPVTNDLELIIDVIRLALDPGYVLIGHTERVYRRDLDVPPTEVGDGGDTTRMILT